MSRPDHSRSSDPRFLALEILLRVEQGAYADLSLDETLRRHSALDPRDRGLLTELVYGVLRRRGRLDYALAKHCSQSLTKLESQVLQTLRLGAYQLLELERIPPSAAVNTSVNLVKQMGLQRASGFVNGVLRGLLRGLPDLAWPEPGKKPLEYLEHVGSLPRWLAQRWLRSYGAEAAIELAEALLQPAPLTLRCNTLRVQRKELLETLRRQDIAARSCRFAPEGVLLENRQALDVLPADWFQVQDEASMLVAHLLQVQPGEAILDCCAAPGGKTTHLAALGNNELQILAMELHRQRLALIEKGARRLGCQGIETRAWDMTRAPRFLEVKSFDRILVDAPCSGLGVLRHNPEIRWRREPGSLPGLAELQQALLAQAVPLLKPGGVLVYSVCTPSREETTEVVAAFLETHPQFVVQDLRQLLPDWSELCDDQGQMSIWPGHAEMDGFFAVRMRKVGA